MTLASGLTYWDAVLPSLLMAAIAYLVLPMLDKHNPLVRIGAIVVCVGLTWNYMFWRINHTIPPETDYVDHVAGIIFTSVEMLAVIGTTIGMFFLTSIRSRSSDVERNVSWLLEREEPPLIDVFICTYNEPMEVLEPAIVGALAMNYPNFRVWVCDDGRRGWLKVLSEHLGANYLTRSDNAHAKAGNINAALAHVKSLEKPPEFISILDADFVPLPEFLTRAASLMKDDTLGVVQTPQHFFNPDPIQSNLSVSHVWPDEQRYFFDVVMASKDAWGGAFCCGTSSIIRVNALEKIGGMPRESVTEDYLLTLKLKRAGYQTGYLNELLSLGLAPESLEEYRKQRSRWCLGFMQICAGECGPLRLGNGLPLVDRVMLVESFLYWAATHLFRLMAIVVPALYLLFDIQAVHAHVLEAIQHLLPVVIVQFFILSWLTDRRVIPIISDLYQLLCSLDVLKSVLAGLFRPKGQKFKVTAKGNVRPEVDVQWSMMRIYLGLMVFVMLGIANAFLLDPSRPLAESSAIAFVWSWYNIIVLTLACYVCVEQKRWREGERFQAYGTAELIDGAQGYRYKVNNISFSGIELIGEPPPQADWGDLLVVVDGMRFRAGIVHVRLGRFALRFDLSSEDRVQLIRYIFSGRFGTRKKTIQPLHVAGAVLARVFR